MKCALYSGCNCWEDARAALGLPMIKKVDHACMTDHDYICYTELGYATSILF